MSILKPTLGDTETPSNWYYFKNAIHVSILANVLYVLLWWWWWWRHDENRQGYRTAQLLNITSRLDKKNIPQKAEIESKISTMIQSVSYDQRGSTCWRSRSPFLYSSRTITFMRRISGLTCRTHTNLKSMRELRLHSIVQYHNVHSTRRFAYRMPYTATGDSWTGWHTRKCWHWHGKRKCTWLSRHYLGARLQKGYGMLGSTWVSHTIFHTGVILLSLK